MIKYKYIVHERTEDAPFIGALIVAPSCNLKCKNCFNKELKKLENKEDTSKTIIKEVLSNPFNEGIILSGLEWSESPKEMIKLIEEAVKYNLKIMIYTGHNIDDFFYKMGKVLSNNKTISNLNELEKRVVFALSARMRFDQIIPYEYYIKTGRYEKDLEVADNIQFGIKLATSNQIIHKFS